MTLLLKAKGSDERRNKDLVHVVRMAPNPSIQGALSGLRPPSAHHVKRWAPRVSIVPRRCGELS
jgi:hypothetical protein